MMDNELDWNRYKELRQQYQKKKADADLIMAELKASSKMTAECLAMYNRMKAINQDLQQKWMSVSDQAQQLAYDMYPFQAEIETKLEEQNSK